MNEEEQRLVTNPCPDCGHEAHNPRTGFCWKSPSRNPRSGIHCGFCCIQPTGGEQTK